MEIYKGKRIVDGKWVQGHLLSIPPKKAYIVTDVDEDKSDCEDTGTSVFWLDCLSHMVDPSTVCRFTGLYDCTKWSELPYKEQLDFLETWNWQKDRKNTAEDWEGRMIWDNDIVKFRHGGKYAEGGNYFRNYKIEYINSYSQYGLRFINKSIHFTCKWSTVKVHDVYVIGNFIDNPELLDVGEYTCPSLEECLREADQIRDDEEFCKAEHDLACTYFKENHYLLNDEDMKTVRIRGLSDTYENMKEMYIFDLWHEFGDVPMNPETECIEAEWHGFPAGTHREDIWHWFEETYDASVAELMGVGKTRAFDYHV